VILPNYERRYHPKYIRLKQQISRSDAAASYRGFFAAGSSTGGALGRSGHEGQAAAGKSLYATKNGDEGVLLHDTTHLLDLVQYLFGPVKRHSVVAGSRWHVLHLEHVGGASGLIETNVGIGVFHLELEVRLPDRRITVGNGFHTTEKIAASRHYRSLKSYAEPQRSHDAKFPVTKNPFVQLYREALYGKPDNGHFFEALDNAILLSQRPQGLLR
jgi:predicted dehydrogenase